jgi:maleylacetate reductase
VQPFVYNGLPSRVIFGAGSIAQLPAELDRLGVKKALLLSTPEQKESVSLIAKTLGARCAGTYDKAAMHVPVEVAEDARRVARELDADCCVTVGGGSTTGLGKAIALTSTLPILAVPTTYAGSEMTPIYGLTEGGLKKTGRDARVLPKTVLYDPLLTLSLPAVASAASGMNAIAHCVEALYAVDGNPIISLMAEEGIRALASSLPQVVSDVKNVEARTDALYGAWLAGVALGAAGMALHHKLCHVLGGTWDLPHAETHAAVIPHVAAFNAVAVPDAMARVARALGRGSAAGGLYDLLAELDIPNSLGAIGMPAAGLDRAAALATANPYWNPRSVDTPAIRALLDDAWAGRRPG